MTEPPSGKAENTKTSIFGRILENPLFGKVGIALFTLTTALLIITALGLPYIMTPLELVFPAKWGAATRLVVQFAFGSWVGATVSSIAKVIIWLLEVYGNLSGNEAKVPKRDAIMVRDFNLWTLGILTALALYMTAWVSGGE